MKYLISVFVIILATGFIFLYLQNKNLTRNQDNPSENLGELAERVYWDVHSRAVANVGDSKFTSFVFGDLENTCPFYKPDGVTYRECLIDLVNKARKDLKKDVEENKIIEDYCYKISSKYSPGLEAIDLYNSCLVYKLSI